MGARSTFTSDASLTQTLYLIRRDLKTLGLDELFITVPKSGIRVNSSITIDVIHEKIPKTKSVYTSLYLGLFLILLLTGIGVYFAIAI